MGEKQHLIKYFGVKKGIIGIMKIGFIGIGNMGGSLLKAVCHRLGGVDIGVCDMDKEKIAAACGEYGCTGCTSAEIAAQAEYIFLGVKPQAMAAMLDEIKAVLAERAKNGGRFILVSMAAGLSVSSIQSMAGGAYPVIRIMPNIPAAVGEGMILYANTTDITDGELAVFLDFMSLAGTLDGVKESLIDAGSALSGCGPAFVSMMIEALADGAVACGLPRNKAMLYAEQTVLGTAKYLMETGLHPGEMKDNVTSPAGTTIQGVRVLEENGFRGACMDAVIAAYEKTVNLQKR